MHHKKPIRKTVGNPILDSLLTRAWNLYLRFGGLLNHSSTKTQLVDDGELIRKVVGKP